MSYNLVSILSSFSFLLVISSHLVHTAFSNDLLYCKCDKDSEDTMQFTDNRAAVLRNLRDNTSTYGFSIASENREAVKEIFGFALCRGDVTKDDCDACLSNATDNVQTACNESREGVISYDYCSLKYSDENFMGVLDENPEHAISLYSMENMGSKVTQLFFNTTRDFLSKDLISKVVRDPNTMFAGGEQIISEAKKKIYGMAQCTKDLSTRGCEGCLQDALEKLQVVRADNGTLESVPMGARYFTPNCMLRYETFSFLLT